tara:strand:- start:1226 stop:10687 length:9462 start_codon:yes stop_codon:yes gene_type:complete
MQNKTKHISIYLLAKYLKLSLAIIFLSLSELDAQNEENSEPDWVVESSSYSSNLSLIGDFYLNEEPFDSDNIVGAFVDGVVRGRAEATSYGSDFRYLMTIYGNTAGEEIEFKAWIADAAEDSIMDIEETIEFVPNGTVGSVSSPQVFTSYRNFDFSPSLTGIVDQSVHMDEGFASFDLNDFLSVRDQDTLLYTATQGDYISVGQADGVITLEPQNGWVGSEDIIFTVTELTENGYSDSDTATFTQLRTDVPPIIAGINDEIVGPNGFFTAFDLDDFITEQDGDSLSYEFIYGDPIDSHDDPEWSVNPQDFEFSMSVIAEVFSRGAYPEGAGHILVAFDEDGVIRGITQGEAYIDDWRYLLTIYSNSEGDKISFRFYDSEDYLNIPIIETVTFVNNSVIGSAATPIDLIANFIDVDLDSEGEVSLARVDPDWRGGEAITFKITDNGTQNSYSDSDDAVYTVDGNYEPILSGIPDQSIGPNGTFSTFDVEDYLQTFDEDGIIYTVSGNSDLTVSFDGSLVTVSHESGYIGIETLVFTATDDNTTAFSSSDSVTFSVLAADNIPQLNEIPDLSITIGASFDTLDLTDYLTELDGDDISWSYEFLDYPSTVSAPDWQAPTSGTYSMELVATVEALGILTEDTEHILVAVNDNNDVLGVSQAVNFQGTWVYNMDLFSSENIVDITFWFYDDNSERIIAVDKDLVFRDGTVSGEATNPIELKAGRILISLSDQGVVTIDILQTNWDLPETVRFTVADASTEDELSSFNDISIMIENDIPALSISSWQTEEGGTFQPIELEQIISDNGTSFDSLAITVQTGSQYSAEITNDYLIVYPPEDADWNGTEEVTLQVSDAHPYDSKTLEATINYVMTPVNDAPVLPQQADFTMEEDEPRTFALEITDIDTGEVFSILVYSDNDSLVVTADSTDSTITASPAADWYGESNITAIVSDGELTDTTEFTITIDPVNDAPRVAIIENINIDEDTELLILLEIANVDTGETLSVFVSSDVGNVLATANSQESTLKLVPAQNWTGQAQITAIVSDGVLAQSVSFTLTVDPVNDRPTVVAKDDEVINEDSSGTYLFEVADVDTGETLQLFVSSSESNVGVQVNSDDFSITATPSANWHGNADLIVSVSDGELVDTTRFTLTVDPVNDAPIIAEKDNETLLEDFISSYLFEVADIDTGETLVLSVLSDTSSVEVTVDSDLEHQSINVAPILNWHGKSTITVIVSDGELTDSTDFELTVVPINDAPTIADVEDKTMLEDNSKTFTFEIADVDTGETLGILVSSSSQDVVVTADSENHSITAVPNENWHGTTEIEVGVTDYDLITTTTFLLTVTPVNDQPHITQFPDITILEDYTETFKLEVSDVDTGEVLALFATTDNSALTITADSENNTISVVPQDNWHGNSEVEVIVTDDELVFAMSFLLTVDPVNDAPTISSKEDQTILEDQSGTYLFQVADIDTGEVLSISAFSEFVEVELIANSEDYSVTTNPIDNWNGTSNIGVILSDGLLTDTTYFDLTVFPVNDAPVISQLPNTTFDENSLLSVYLDFSDVDENDILSLTSFSDSDGVTTTSNSSSATLEVTSPDFNGDSEITVIVSDGELLDTTSFIVTIAPTNDAPIITPIENISIQENEEYILELDLTDIDLNEFLNVSAYSDTADVIVTPNLVTKEVVSTNEDSSFFFEEDIYTLTYYDSTITIQSTPNWHGFAEITVVVSDGELTDIETFQIAIGPVNDAPTIAAAPDQIMSEDDVQTYSFEVADIDTGTVLNIFAFSDTSSVSVLVNSDDFTVTASPEPDWHGEVEIMVVVSDNFLTDTTTFNLVVDPVNDAPTISAADDQTIFENGSGVFPLQIADIDTGEALMLSASSDQPLVLVSTNSEEITVAASAIDNWHGDANIMVIVSDGELTDSTFFTLTVEPVNNAPTIAEIGDGSFLENSEFTTFLNPDDIDTSETLSLYAFSDTSGVTVLINNDSSYFVVSSEDFHGVAEIPLVLSSPDFYGVSEITVIVSDGFLTDTTSFFVTIAPTNDAPIITPISDQSALENTIFVYELELTDIDTGEVLIINAFSDISDVVVAANSDDSTLTISTTLEWYGTALITVIVSDGELNDLETFVMNFGPVNDAPTISQIPDSFIEENNVFETPIHWADIDTGEVLILTAFADTNAVELDVNTIDSLFTITPDSAWNGTANIKLFVSDGELADSTLFSLTVGPINDAPVITPIADSFIAENSIFELDLELTDIDTGEVLTLSAFADTSAMVVTANSADSSITAIPADDWNGTAQITVVVSDGELTDTVRFLLDVGPLNDAPVIVQVSSISIDEDESYLLPVSFFDVDAQDELTLSAFADTSSLDLFADVDSSSVLIVPEMNWHGSSTISVVVSDGNLNDTTSFTFTADPVNDAPIISEASDAFTVEDSLYIGEYYITDIDTGDVLTLSAFSDTSAIDIHAALDSNIISFIPDPDWNGISEITVIVADGELSDTTQFMLTVSNVPDKPYAILQDDINSIQGQVMLIDGSESYDIDDDPLQYYWSIIPEDSLFALEGIIGDTVVTETAYLEFQSPIRSSEHKFNIKLWVENTSNLFSDEDSLMLTVQTLEANDILPDLSSLMLEAGKAVPITITIPDGFIVDSISINYADAYSGFISNSMIQQEQTGRSGTEYFYEIPFYLAGLEGLAYYVYVEDAYGSIILTDTTDINLAFNDGVVSSGIMHSEFAYGFPRDVWRMISVPSYLDNSQLESILGDAVGSYSESTWMIYDWNAVEGGGEDGSPAGWIQPTQLLPGKAYWLKQVIADAPTFVAPSGKTVELSGYDIEIDPGWNMISSPYLFPVSVEYDLNNFSELYLYGTNISSEPSIDGYLEGWADSTISVMSPWAGYAIYNKTETVQTIQINPLNKNRRQIARSSSGDADWSLKIGVQSSKYFDHKNEFGISRMASNKIDRNDSPEPPVFDKYISFYSSTKNSYGQDKKITTDYRNSDDSLKVWNLVLETNIEEESAQMDIKLNGSIGSEVLWLIDMQNGNTFNIGHDRSISKIVSISTQMVNRYKLVYGNDAEVESLVKAIVALIPKEFSLGHNYPNPFNPSTTIPFTISSPGLAAVTIYDVNGRQIKQIVNENFKPGFYSRVWDGKNSNGIPVSSGVYYYGLRTKTFNSFKKMILIK